MTSPAPRVSVVLPVYNGLPWVQMAAESVAWQTHRDLEILAYNDGSTDGSAEVLDAWAARDARVRVVHQDNRGLVATLNRGLEEACGEFIARFDADDLSYPTRIEKQVAFLDAHPEVGVLGTECDTARPTGTGHWKAPSDVHLSRWTLLFNCTVAHSAVAMRTALIRQLGGYDSAARHAEDYDLWTRAAQTTDVVNLPERLAWVNKLRGDSVSELHAAEQASRVVRSSVAFAQTYLPTVDPARVRDLMHLAHRADLAPDGPAGSREARIASAVRLLRVLRAAFLRRHAVPAASARRIARDLREKRLSQLRWALIREGGLGHVGRLHRTAFDSTGVFLQLPGLVRRA